MNLKSELRMSKSERNPNSDPRTAFPHRRGVASSRRKTNVSGGSFQNVEAVDFSPRHSRELAATHVGGYEDLNRALRFRNSGLVRNSDFELRLSR